MLKMNIQAKHYERIVILNISGPITKEDVVALEAEVPPLCKTANVIILVFGKDLERKDVIADLIALRDKTVKSKPRFLLAGGFDRADGPDLVGVLDGVNSAEGDRIIQIFARGYELVKIGDKLKSVELELANTLRARLGLEASKTAMTPQELESSLAKFKDQNRKLKHLYKTWGSEIEALRKQRPKTKSAAQADPASLEKLKVAKKNAVGALKTEGLLGKKG